MQPGYRVSIAVAIDLQGAFLYQVITEPGRPVSTARLAAELPSATAREGREPGRTHELAHLRCRRGGCVVQSESTGARLSANRWREPVNADMKERTDGHC